MSRFAAGLTTSAGSTTLPLCALVGGTGSFIRIRTIAVYNTTATACTLVLARLSTAGTPGASATSRLLNSADTTTAVGVLKNTYTSTAPTTQELGIRFPLPAAVGGGIIRPFEDFELTIPATANAGIGLLVLSGTGQACEVDITWME
jgi:hypothetical protein